EAAAAREAVLAPGEVEEAGVAREAGEARRREAGDGELVRPRYLPGEPRLELARRRLRVALRGDGHGARRLERAVAAHRRLRPDDDRAADERAAVRAEGAEDHVARGREDRRVHVGTSLGDERRLGAARRDVDADGVGAPRR